MKQGKDIGKEATGQNMQGFDDSIIISFLTMVQIQPAINVPLIFLIKSRGTCLPDCRYRPETGYNLNPDIQPVFTKWSNIKN